MVSWVDSIWAKTAIKQPEKMEKQKGFLKLQQFFIWREQEAQQETKANNRVLQKLWYH